MAHVTSIHVNSSNRITLYLEGSNPLEDYYPAFHNVSQAQAEKLLAEKGKIHGCTIEGLNYRHPGEPMPSDHKTAKRLARKWNVQLKDKVLGGGSSVGGGYRMIGSDSPVETYRTKVAVIRDPLVPPGGPAPMWLNCPCGANPETRYQGGPDVTCACGTVYTSGGYVKSSPSRGLRPSGGGKRRKSVLPSLPEFKPILARLKREATEGVQARGHKLGRWYQLSPRSMEATCKLCARNVVINARPSPNDIDIGGSACGLNCHMASVGGGTSGNQCEACGRTMNPAERMMGPVCGACTRKRHHAVTGGGKARHARRGAHWSYMVHGPETLREFPSKREAVKFGTRLAKKSRRKYKNPLRTFVEKVKTDRSGVHSQYAPGAGVVWTSDEIGKQVAELNKLLK
jgi:hypothetical protein